jgi:hypothetical protein
MRIRTASCPSPGSTSLSIVSGAGTVSLCPPQWFPCLFSDERCCLIRLVYLQPSTVDHEEQLIRQVRLIRPQKAKRDHALPATSLREQCSQAETLPGAVNAKHTSPSLPSTAFLACSAMP